MSEKDMPESPTQNKKNNNPPINEKSIPKHIIDGSIVIDSIEAFSSILKQFPKEPALLKKYADLLFRQELLDLAAKSYGEAARLYIDSGQMLQALVAQKQQWLIKPPSKKEIHLFLSALEQGNFKTTPLKMLFDKLAPKEILAIISGFVRVRLFADKTIQKAGDRETDLYFIVSGTLKDSIFPSLETKEKVHRKPSIYLSDEDFFGEIYPFKKDQTCKSDIKTMTQVELVKISRQKLMKLCREFPNLEPALIDLLKIRSGSEAASLAATVRKAERYQLPIKMNLELAPKGSFKNPLIIDGYSSDISIGGICVVLNGQSKQIGHLLASLPETADNSQIRVSFPEETMELKVLGNIMWRHEIHFNGSKTLALGIRFEEDSPKLRGMLFMFANSLGMPKELPRAS
ncbi:MAG: cyclic nucleotide-binding domain-containing protein [Desulfobacteraceae bacterium]|nr:cyclic nucleotide-binding domain-containing protein [Desulfobacteraceae bacterium]